MRKFNNDNEDIMPLAAGLLIGLLLSTGVYALIEIFSETEVLRITKGEGRTQDFRTIYMNGNKYVMHASQIEHVYYSPFKSDDVIEIRHATNDYEQPIIKENN